MQLMVFTGKVILKTKEIILVTLIWKGKDSCKRMQHSNHIGIKPFSIVFPFAMQLPLVEALNIQMSFHFNLLFQNLNYLFFNTIYDVPIFCRFVLTTSEFILAKGNS